MKSILDKFPDFLYISDTDTYEILFMNSSLRSMLKQPLAGKKCYQLLQGKSEPCSFCTNDIIKKTKMPHVWDFYNSHVGRHFLITDQIIKWHDGRDVRFETAIDITDQKKIEALLHASETKYRSFIEQSNYGFFILNMKQEVTYLNSVARKIYGIGDNEHMSLKISDLLDPEELEIAMKNIRAISKGTDVARTGVYKIIRPDGMKKVVEIQTFPIWKEGKLDGFHGTVIDMTEKVENEARLKEKSELLDAVFNNTTDGIFVVDEDLKYILINPASGRILGYDPKEWIGKKAGTFKHPDDAKAAADAFLRAMGGEHSSCEIRVMAKDGTYHLLEIRYNQMKMSDNYHVLGMVTDITERRRAENALIASEEKYRSLFENSPEAIVILGNEGRIIECNNATAGLMEKRIEDIIGKRFDELGILDTSQLDIYRKNFKAMVEGKELNKGEIQIFMTGGGSKWIEVFPSIIYQNR